MSDTFKNKILFCPPLLILFTGGRWAVLPIKKWKIKCRIRTNRNSLLILNVSVLNAAFEDMYEDMSFFWKPFLSSRAKVAKLSHKTGEVKNSSHTWVLAMISNAYMRRSLQKGRVMDGFSVHPNVRSWGGKITQTSILSWSERLWEAAVRSHGSCFNHPGMFAYMKFSDGCVTLNFITILLLL